MIGTLINIAAIIIGGSLGLLFGAQLPKRIQQTVISGLGLFTLAIGIQMFLKTQNPIIPLGSILIGGVLGEWWKIETRLSKLGGYLEKKFTKEEDVKTEEGFLSSDFEPDSPKGSRFMQGFLTSSLIFCIGPMAILGSIQDGLTGDYSLLAIKAVLDGFGSVAFAASLGVGVLFSALVLLVFQGGISLLAGLAQAMITTQMMEELTAVGGILLLGLAISSLLEIKSIRAGNFLPALFISPLIVGILEILGLG